MKNDPFFKFVAVVIVAGVFVALLSPNHALDSKAHASAVEVAPHTLETSQ